MVSNIIDQDRIRYLYVLHYEEKQLQEFVWQIQGEG